MLRKHPWLFGSIDAEVGAEARRDTPQVAHGARRPPLVPDNLAAVLPRAPRQVARLEGRQLLPTGPVESRVLDEVVRAWRDEIREEHKMDDQRRRKVVAIVDDQHASRRRRHRAHVCALPGSGDVRHPRLKDAVMHQARPHSRVESAGP